MRNKELVEKGTISRQRYDDLYMQFQVAINSKDQSFAALLEAESALLQARANLAQAEANLGAPGDSNAQLRSSQGNCRTS